MVNIIYYYTNMYLLSTDLPSKRERKDRDKLQMLFHYMNLEKQKFEPGSRGLNSRLLEKPYYVEPLGHQVSPPSTYFMIIISYFPRSRSRTIRS